MDIKIAPGRLVVVLLVITVVTSKSFPKEETPQSSTPAGPLRFKVRIRESGNSFTEKVEVDAEGQTETFHVPQHNQVDRSSVMHMFDLNLTVYRLPLKGACYVTALKTDQPPPLKLAEDMTRNNGIHGNDEQIESSTYLIRGQAATSQNPKVRIFCIGFNILDAERFDNDWFITKDEETTRKRRQANSPSGTCPPNDDFPLDCPMHRIQRRCLINGQTCTYFRNCGLEEQPGGQMVTACRTRHLLDDFICCTNYCREE